MLIAPPLRIFLNKFSDSISSSHSSRRFLELSRNPNFCFIFQGSMDARKCPDMNSNLSEEDEVQRTEDEEIDNKSSDEDANRQNQRLKRKRYNRHTPHQIRVMEAFFKECPHPDTLQRNELSKELGMDALQIKFWFQNKRTQMKSKHERQENRHLRAENEKLQAENMRYREALSNACCPACGRVAAISDHLSLDERQLRLENARLKEEIERISTVAASYVGKPFTTSAAAAPINGQL